jgi:ribosomal protein L31E
MKNVTNQMFKELFNMELCRTKYVMINKVGEHIRISNKVNDDVWNQVNNKVRNQVVNQVKQNIKL